MNGKYKAGTFPILCAAIAGYAFAAPAPDTQGNEHHSPQVVLFGNAQRWVWNGESWRQKSPATSPPGGGAIAYDARGKVVLFSTYGASVTQTWVWDGEDWQEKFPATNPSATGKGFPLPPGMAYDAARRETVLFEVDENNMPETWVWDGENWHRKFPASSPSSRGIYGTMAYDGKEKKVLLFGGQETGAELQDSDTWEWDGSNWEQKSPAPHPDGTLGGFSAAFDAARCEVVLFGRSYMESNAAVVPVTWIWESEDWEQVSKQQPFVWRTYGLRCDRPQSASVSWFSNVAVEWQTMGPKSRRDLRSPAKPLAGTGRCFRVCCHYGRLLVSL